MKHLKIALLALLFIMSYSTAMAQDEENNAQDREHPWMLTFSTNYISIVDGESENFVPWLSKINVAKSIGKGFALEFAGSVNRISRPWGTADDVTFVGLDLNLKYDLNNLFGQTGWFDPFLFVGAGQNYVGTSDGFGLNVGGGFNSWLNDDIAINFTSGYKSVNTPEDFKMWQHSIGLAWRFGNNDSDEDGIRDKDDDCPNVFGLAEFNGCPDTDADDDGVKDCCDKCPNTPGLAEFKGCPDTDGDGIPDVKDKCPEVAGTKAMHGCPDSDGDGVRDSQDACPDVPGPKTNAGCPFKDTDEDGVIDLVDHCVDTPGPASNNGCPEVFEDDKTINEAAKGILFDTGKDEIKPEVGVILDDVARILNLTQNRQFNFAIEGHTDSTGSEERNMILSNERAAAVRAYLMSKGVNPNRLTTVGHGESKPIDTNNTKEGRTNNRRVEINEVK